MLKNHHISPLLLFFVSLLQAHRLVWSRFLEKEEKARACVYETFLLATRAMILCVLFGFADSRACRAFWLCWRWGDGWTSHYELLVEQEKKL